MFASMMLVSHTISDFIIQTSSIVELKSQLKLKGFLLHGAALLASSLIMLIPVKAEQMLITALYLLLIVCIHLITDYLKELFQGMVARRRKFSNFGKFMLKLVLFTLDQIIHIAVILLIAGSLQIELAGNLTVQGFGSSEMMYLFLVMYFAFSGVYFIPAVMDVIYYEGGGYKAVLGQKIKDAGCEPNKLDKILKTDRWLGFAERGLILLVLVLGYWYAIFGIIILNIISRRKLAFNKTFSGFFIVCTISNLLYAIFGFFVLPLLLG